MMNGLNPWAAMWVQPKKTIRAVLAANPRYGVFYLSALYVLQALFYSFNYWSLGLSVPFFLLVLSAAILSPVLGICWLYWEGWILYIIGRWLRGKAPAAHVRTALAWSKIPLSVSLLMWLALIAFQPDYVFILDALNTSWIVLHFVLFILTIWSLILLIESLCEVQSFHLPRAICNGVIAWAIYSISLFLFFMLFRFLYLLTV